MIKIDKKQGPASLITYAAAGNRYDAHTSFSAIKKEIRDALCKEQGYICCFCMRRIEPNEHSTQIAHIQNQAAHQLEDCEYKNFMGSCSTSNTCNAAQKNRDLKYNPTDKIHPIENFIRYEPDGKIISDDLEFNEQINKWLNLKFHLLEKNRSAIYRSINELLKKAKSFDNKKNIAKKRHVSKAQLTHSMSLGMK